MSKDPAPELGQTVRFYFNEETERFEGYMLTKSKGKEIWRRCLIDFSGAEHLRKAMAEAHRRYMENEPSKT